MLGTPRGMDGTPGENPLSAASLSRFIVDSIAGGRIANSYEAIALASHASLLAVGFRLVGLGDDHKIEAGDASTSDGAAPLPKEWNASKGIYAFRYRHSQSTMEFLLKINSMGNKATVTAMGMGDDNVHHIDVKTNDWISDGNLPTPEINKDGADKDETKKIVLNVYINGGRLSDFGKLMRVQVIQKLVPSLHKPGYQETSTTHGSRQPAPGREDDRPGHDPLRDGPRDPEPARPYPLADPLAQPRNPNRPLPEPIPGFEDEFETQRGPRGRGGMGGGFPRIGERDLYPQGLGPNDPLRGGIGPGLCGMGGGGMHPTFDDPLFQGQGQGGRFNPHGPPGSRYDDPGPNFGGGPGGHPRGAGMGGRPPNPFGGFGDGDFI